MEKGIFETNKKQTVGKNCRDFNKTYAEFGLKSPISEGLSMDF